MPNVLTLGMTVENGELYDVSDPPKTPEPTGDETNGLEDVVDWDELEGLLDADACPTKQAFGQYVRGMFAEAGLSHTRSLYNQVIAGLWPEYREKYDALGSGLNEEVVALLRFEYETLGRTVKSLARTVGVGESTVRDIVKYKTWRNVA